MKVALLVLVLDPGALNPFSHVKALVSHGTAYVLLGLLTALALYHASQMARWSPLHVPVAAYVVAYVLATAFALDQRVALYGAPDRSLGLVSVLDSVLVYVAVVALLRTRTDLFWLGSTLGGATVVMVGYALVQKVGLDPIPWASEIVEARPFSTTGNPGVLGQYMATVLAGAGAFAILANRAAAHVALASTVVAAGALVGALLAGARSSLFGILAGGLVVAASHAARLRWRGRVLVAAGSFVSIVVVAAALLAAFGFRGQALSSGAVGETLATAAAGGSVAGRLDIYRVAFQQLRDRPVLGVGPDNYVVAYPRYRSPEHSRFHESDAAQSSAHSWFWKTATDAGILGLAAFLAVVLTGLAIGIRGIAMFTLSGATSAAAVAALAAYLGTGLFSIDHVATAWMPWAALGTIVAGPRAAADAQATGILQADRSRRRRAPRPSAWRRGATVGVLAASLLLALSMIRPAQASHAGQEARRAHGLGERGLPAMHEAAERAVELDPNRAEYWSIRGAAAFASQDFNAAAEAFRRASEIAPYEFSHLTSLARAQVNVGLRGDREALAASVETARRAVELDPYVAEVHYTLALALLGNGSAAEAVVAIEQGHRLKAPHSDEPYRVAARGYIELGRLDDAERWLEAADARGTWPEAQAHGIQLLWARLALARGDRAEAANRLAGVLAEDPGSEEARRLQADLVEEATEDLLLTETFRMLPEWRILGGGGIGSVRRNVLLTEASPLPWQAIVGSQDWTDVRMSVQFQFTPVAGESSFEVGRWRDTENSVVVRHSLPSQETRLLKRVAGQEVELASKYLRSLQTGSWYWLQIEFRKSHVIVMLFDAGAEPKAKAESILRGVLSANVGDDGPRSGAMIISTDFMPPVEIGGIEDRPGGVYVERLQ